MLKFFGYYNIVECEIETELIERGFHKFYTCKEFSFFLRETVGANQPYIISEDNSYLMISGHIINFGEFYSELNTPEGNNHFLHNFLRRYRQDGERIIDQLEGSFALVLWDDDYKKLYFCRDDGGSKLLYYCKFGKAGLMFSNDLRELIKISKRKMISKRGLSEYLRFLDISPPYTIHKDIWLLEPEVVFSIGSKETNLRCKETTRDQIYTENIEVLDHSINTFEKLFRDSIKKRLLLTSKLGVFLSGGIDSALVCAVAADMTKDLKALTVGFDEPQYDESHIARNIARYLGIDHEIMVFSRDQDLKSFYEFTSSIGSPFADPAIIPTIQCFKNIGYEIDLVLDGTGADTLIGVMPARHLRFILKYSRHITPKVRSWIAKLMDYNKKTANYSDLFSFEDATEMLIRWKGWTKKEITELCGKPCDLSHTMFYRIYKKNPKINPYDLYSMLMGALPDERIHHSSSMFGPDVSFPFFDRTIQSYVRTLPFKYRYHKGQSKILFRALLGKYIPQKIWDVPKHGFDYPFENLLRINNFQLLNEYFSPNSLGKHDLFKNSIIDEYVFRYKQGDHGVKFKIWALVLFQAWYENFFDKL